MRSFKNVQILITRQRLTSVQRIARYAAQLLAERSRNDVTPELYQAQRNANWIPRIEAALKYFSNFDELLDAGQKYNHRIVSKRLLDEYADVYDITVDKYHNFLLGTGVFVRQFRRR